MATRKAIAIFDAAASNVAMYEKLLAIASDDRWSPDQKAMNCEIAELAFSWAREAFRHYNREAPSKEDAKLVLQIALLIVTKATSGQTL